MNNENILNEIEDIIVKGDAVKLNKIAEKIGKTLANPPKEIGGSALSTSQIRNILDKVQRIEKKEKIEKELQLLRPLLAYNVGRHKNKVKVFEVLYKYLDYAIGLVGNDKEKFKNFKNFFEAIVAYHRFYGGKE